MHMYEQITRHNKKAINVLSLLFAIEVILASIVLASTHYLGNLGLGGIIFILPFILIFSTLITMLIVIPIFSINAIRKKQARTGSEHFVVWSSLALNLAAVCMLAVGIAITAIDAATL